MSKCRERWKTASASCSQSCSSLKCHCRAFKTMENYIAIFLASFSTTHTHTHTHTQARACAHKYTQEYIQLIQQLPFHLLSKLCIINKLHHLQHSPRVLSASPVPRPLFNHSWNMAFTKSFSSLRPTQHVWQHELLSANTSLIVSALHLNNCGHNTLILTLDSS